MGAHGSGTCRRLRRLAQTQGRVWMSLADQRPFLAKASYLVRSRGRGESPNDRNRTASRSFRTHFLTVTPASPRSRGGVGHEARPHKSPLSAPATIKRRVARNKAISGASLAPDCSHAGTAADCRLTAASRQGWTRQPCAEQARIFFRSIRTRRSTATNGNSAYPRLRSQGGVGHEARPHRSPLSAPATRRCKDGRA